MFKQKLLLQIALFCFTSLLAPQSFGQRLGVVGDNHAHLSALIEPIRQMRAQGLDYLIVTGDTVSGNDPEELHGILQAVVKESGLPRERIFFVKGNYEDWGYFANNPREHRKRANQIMREHVTPVLKPGAQRPIHDDELGFIEIPSGSQVDDAGKPKIFKIAISHKPLWQLPFTPGDKSKSLVQPPEQQRNWRNGWRPKDKPKLLEPDTSQTMQYEDDRSTMRPKAQQVAIPEDTYVVIYGHTHIAGYFVDDRSGVPMVNPGSPHPFKKPRDQYMSYMTIDLASGQAQWHNARAEGAVLTRWNLIAAKNESAALKPADRPSRAESCARIMGETASALDRFQRAASNFNPANILPFIVPH